MFIKLKLLLLLWWITYRPNFTPPPPLPKKNYYKKNLHGTCPEKKTLQTYNSSKLLRSLILPLPPPPPTHTHEINWSVPKNMKNSSFQTCIIRIAFNIRLKFFDKTYLSKPYHSATHQSPQAINTPYQLFKTFVDQTRIQLTCQRRNNSFFRSRLFTTNRVPYKLACIKLVSFKAVINRNNKLAK